jgi:DNA ligase-1
MQSLFALSSNNFVQARFVRLRFCVALLFFIAVSVILIRPACAQQSQPSPVMLANSYQRGIDLAAYWISEKYDGVRGYWDGKKLWTRGGEIIKAPAWFVKDWPDTAMDGELWAGRGNFAVAVSTVRMQTPDDGAWRKMRFMVFDLPAHGGVFDVRLRVLKLLVRQIDLPWVQAVRQVKVGSHQALLAMMQKVVSEGGEGLMLHRGASLYRAERNDDLLKLKPFDDAEARVIAYVPGKGKYQGQLGALLVETAQGLRFKLGSGFSDAERAAPPPIGAIVTYRYRGVNQSGIPRFATFLRVRGDM